MSAAAALERRARRRPRRWSEDERARLKQLRDSGLPIRAIARDLARNYEAVRTAIQRFGLTRRRYWSEEERGRLRQLYPGLPTKELARSLDRDVWAIYGMAAKLGLVKSPEFLASEQSGRLRKGQHAPGSERHWFAKGHVPANKGLRRPGWHTGRMKETQFRKGMRSGKAAENWVPIGTILPDSEGYLRIKVREAAHGKEPTGYGNTKVWPLYNRYLWAKHKGPIPPKHLVIFKDGDRAHCTIENLELLSMADNARRNSMWKRLPREVAEVIQLNGALKTKIRRLTNGTQQNNGSAGSPVRDT